METIVVAALYKFVRLSDFADLRTPLREVMQANNVKGTLLLAEEGINGTIAGSRRGIDAVLAWLKKDERLQDLDHKESLTEEMPFLRTKVKLKKEIVTLGVPGIDPLDNAGTYVTPEKWNELISDPEVLLIDTRNEYEIEIGSFKGAVNPDTETFREFPAYVAENLDPARNKKVAMFCTGGIRCEKSTAYLKSQGFEEVYHLKGGILKYLEEVPAEQSLWEGDCFVFDDRVSVGHNLQQGEYDQCHACRRPVSQEDMKDPAYVPGVSCPHCIGKTSSERKVRFQQRQKQIELAKERGARHLGS